MIKYNFCTLFDSNYIIQGMTMYHSLKKHCHDFHLYILAFDDQLVSFLLNANLEHVTVITLAEFENERLLEVKKDRTQGEYCWTCSSSSILYVLQKYNVPSCTYIDADLFFLSNPSCLIDEMGEKHVLITPHRYSKEYEYIAAYSGKYCVQFVTIKNTNEGLAVLNWWVDKCIEWCYNRSEDGKLGDQKYLDYFSMLFHGVHESVHEGGGLAPWNVDNYNYINGKVKNRSTGQEWEPVFYHFHGLKFFDNNTVFLTNYILKSWVYHVFYTPYRESALNIYHKLSEILNDPKIGLMPFNSQYSYVDDLKTTTRHLLSQSFKLLLLLSKSLKSIVPYKYFRINVQYLKFK